MKYLVFSMFILIMPMMSQAQLALFPAPSSAHGCGTYIQSAGIYLDDKPLFDGLNASGNRLLDLEEKGYISVNTIRKVFDKIVTDAKVEFVIAVQDERTGTQRIVDLNVHEKISIQELRKYINPGDNIIIMTTDQKIALPNHKLIFNWGC